MSKARRRRAKATPPAAKKRNRVHYNQRLAEVQPALYPRAFTAKRLNISLAYILRLEKSGILDVVRLNPSLASQVFHKAEQVERLVQGEKV